MKVKVPVLLYLLFFLTFFPSFGQKDKKQFGANLNFHLLNVSSGLSHNFINDITQDSLGFIWIATYDGLNRYDGSDFLQFKNQSPARGLANNYVQDIEILSNQLLIATDAGMNIYNLRTGKFKLLDSQNGLYNNNVSAIEKLNDDQIIVGTYRGGVQITEGEHEVLSLQKFFKANSPELSSKEISSIAVQGDSIIWIGTYDNGLNKICLEKDSNKCIRGVSALKLQSPIINNLYLDSHSNLWIGTGKGVQVITRDSKVLSLFKSKGDQSGLSDDDVLCFQEDKHGQMWIGTRNGGLNILDIKSFLYADDLKLSWFLPRNDGRSVFNRTVSVIFQDKDENMWLGTPTGINFVNPGGENISLFTHELSKSSLSHNRIGSLAKAGGNDVWIGTDGGGLDLFDPNGGGRIKHFEHESNNKGSSLSNNYLLSIYQQSPEKVWIGTYQGGLNLLNPQKGTCKHYLQGTTSDGSDVRKIFESRENVLWVGTNRGGLFRYDQKMDGFEYVYLLGKIDIRDIAEDEKGALWLATYGSGIIKFDPKKNSKKVYTQSSLNGLNSDVIFSILVLTDGDILAGCRYGGLLRFNPESEEIRSFTEQDGLSNNTINSLVKEDSVYVWMGSYNGLNRYDTHTNEILNMSSLDNVQEGEFNIDAAVRNRAGKMFFGGNNGLNVFDPKSFNLKERDYPLVFEDLRVLNKEVKVAGKSGKSILNETLFFQNKIRLAYDQNTFSISFAALKYPEARNISYSYKLENYNKFWIDNHTSRTANFTSVPPGEYKLLVKTTSGLGDENMKELKVVIIPPFWKTVPAYFLYGLLIILLIWLSSRYYSERIKLKNSLLFEKKQRNLEHQLNEERFQFFTAFSHELKTPLTLILAPVENLLSKNLSKEYRKDLTFIHKNAYELFKAINKLLEFRKTEEGLSRLQKETVDLSAKLRKWVKNYIPLAKDKNMRIDYSGPIESQYYLIDTEKLEVIINNLLSNAIKYSEEGGNVKLTLDTDSQSFTVKVEDNGSGIKAEDLSHIFEWYYRAESSVKRMGTGIGLALSKRLAELHGGSIDVESQEGKGTLFILTIPAEKVDGRTEMKNASEETEISYLGEKLHEQHANIKAKKERELILIIDDKEDILSFLSRIFRSNYDIIFANNGEEGIQQAKRYVPDLILSDVMMPGKSGLDLCYELKNDFSTSHIPIILLTAKTAVESITVGYKEGADDYITKPFHPKLLKVRVQNLLESRLRLKKQFGEDSDFLEEVDEEDKGVLSREKNFLAQLNKVIHKQIQENSTGVEEIAQGVGMSRTSLYRKLKAITGFNINEYIRNFKVEMAADLLRNENYSVSQASFDVGFNDVKYFRKVFKEKYGKSPSRFKN